MGRLAWLIVLGAGPLAASLLVAHGRASFTAAMAKVAATSSDPSSDSAGEAALAARAAAECELCTDGDRGIADLNEGRMYEGRGALEDAQAHFLSAWKELSPKLIAGPQRGLANDALARVSIAIDRRDADLREQARLAQKAKAAAAPTLEAVKVTVTSLVERGEAALVSGDARGALVAIADIDARDETSDPALRDRALTIGGKATALQNEPSQSDDYFAQAVTLELEHREQPWSDPVTTLRLWSDTVGTRVSAALTFSLANTQRVLSFVRGVGFAQQAARIRMITGETLVAHGKDAEAAKMFEQSIGDLLGDQVPDSQSITRDLAKLGMLEAKQGKTELAAGHLRTAAQRLDLEVEPVRERSETWRHLAEVNLGHPWHPTSISEAVDADQRALAAVAPQLDPDDSEVVRDRIELGIALMRAGDRKGAQAQVTTVDHDTNQELSGELETQASMLRQAIATGHMPAVVRPHPHPRLEKASPAELYNRMRMP